MDWHGVVCGSSCSICCAHWTLLLFHIIQSICYNNPNIFFKEKLVTIFGGRGLGENTHGNPFPSRHMKEQLQPEEPTSVLIPSAPQLSMPLGSQDLNTTERLSSTAAGRCPGPSWALELAPYFCSPCPTGWFQAQAGRPGGSCITYFSAKTVNS